MNNGSMKLFRREYSYSLIAEIQGLFECETYCSIYTLKFVFELQKSMSKITALLLKTHISKSKK